MTWDQWHDILFTFTSTHHQRHAIVMMVQVAIFIIVAFRVRLTAVIFGVIWGPVAALISWRAWVQVMVRGSETHTYSVHCIWFNALVALAYLMVLGLLLRDGFRKRLNE